jgi:hypothetical protein
MQIGFVPTHRRYADGTKRPLWPASLKREAEKIAKLARRAMARRWRLKEQCVIEIL